MKALRFWIEIAKGLLGVWDETVKEMGYTPFKASKKVTEAKTKDGKGSPTPNRLSVGSVTRAQLEEIATTKLPDLNTTKISSAMKIVEGTARNMGISIVD